MVLFKKFILTLLAFLMLLFCALLSKRWPKPILSISAEEAKVNLNHKLYQYFNLGNKRFIASLLWVDTLMDSDTEHYKRNDGNSWMFYRFNTISELDPLFKQVYQYGGPYLSVIKDEIPGASLLYDKGLNWYPSDFFLVFNAGYHFYFEERQIEKAVTLFDRIKFHPLAPNYLPSLVAKIKAEQGDLKTAFELMRLTYLKAEPGLLKEKLFRSLYALKAEIDLNCLNTSVQNSQCQKSDLEGNAYLRENGRYRARKEWQAARPTIRKRNQ